MTADSTPLRYARVPATMGHESWSDKSGHTTTVGTVQGRGTSAAKALADLGDLLAAASRDESAEPSFWADENGGLWVAVPDVMHGGFRDYRVSGVTVAADATVKVTGSGSGDASEAYTSAAGMRKIPPRW
jgi:hypothetical protein